MQFPDSTLVALDLASNEPSRFGRTLIIALVLTAASICAALWVEIETFQGAATSSSQQPALMTARSSGN